jgi:hypothetical protein
VVIFLVRKTSIEEGEREHFLKRRVHIKNSLLRMETVLNIQRNLQEYIEKVFK